MKWGHRNKTSLFLAKNNWMHKNRNPFPDLFGQWNPSVKCKLAHYTHGFHWCVHVFAAGVGWILRWWHDGRSGTGRSARSRWTTVVTGWRGWIVHGLQRNQSDIKTLNHKDHHGLNDSPMTCWVATGAVRQPCPSGAYRPGPDCCSAGGHAYPARTYRRPWDPCRVREVDSF